MAACGGVTNDERAASASAEACAAFADALCARLEACAPELVGRAGPERQRYEGRADCVASQAAICELSAVMRDTGVTSTVVDTCAASVSASGCDVLSREYAAFGSACVVRSGTRALEAACSVDAQCASGRCGWSEKEACGKCYKAWWPEGGLPIAGDACTIGGNCASNATCVEDVCAQKDPATHGDPCSSVFDDGPPTHCAAGEECLNQADHGGGTCTAYAREGEACGDSWTGPVCLKPWQCIDGNCRLPDACG